MSEEKIEISKELLIDTVGWLIATDRIRKGCGTGGDHGMGTILTSSNFYADPLFEKLFKELSEDDKLAIETRAQDINDDCANARLARSADLLLEPYLIYDFDQLYNHSKEKEERWAKEKYLMTNRGLVEFLESDAVKKTIQTNTRKAFQYLENVKDFESRLNAFKKALKDETPTPF